MAFLGNGISTIGFPCNDVYNITVHTYIHTYIRSVSSSDSFTAPILKNPPPTATHQNFFSPIFHLLFIKNKKKNKTEKNKKQKHKTFLKHCQKIKQLGEPVLALWTMYKQKRRKPKKKRKSSKIIQQREKSVASSLHVIFFLIFMSLSSYFFFHLKRFCQAIKRTHVPLSLAYWSEIYTKMCIHEQLETLHDTMSAHMKTYKMWMSSKTILPFTSFVCLFFF